MEKEIILLKLGEIALKGLNRRAFEDVLIKNIRRRLKSAGEFSVYSRQSTVYVEPKDENADMDLAEERCGKVFGVVAYTRAGAADGRGGVLRVAYHRGQPGAENGRASCRDWW